ncbi:hypothetical protein EV175_005135 [Coemansia sp. RSA 1933]|nr:hypothetical protein EV175_005135 [Coemansia sp. RSA 1933]
MAAAALAHIHLSRGNTALALQAVASFTKLSARFGWPMHALARSVELLVGADKTIDACAMLLATANRDHYAFVKILQDSSLLNANAVVLRTLIDDELAIRLHVHRLQGTDHSDPPPAHATNTKQGFSLPVTAFFAPNGPVYLKDHDSVKDTIRKYYANLEHILRSATDQQAFTNISVALVSEASGWVFRLQPSAPLSWLTHALITHTEALDRESISQLLLEYTRALHDYRMIQYVDASNGTAVYANTLTGYTCLRQPLLREYLRHGIDPPPEALVIFAQHMSISGEHTDAQDLAATIFPQMYPQLTGSQYPGYQGVRSYYEWIIELCGAHSSRSQLRLFRYLMGHHGIDCFRYKQRLLEVTVCSFLRHAYFHGMGFYQLERAFVRYVARPWFPAGYFATVLPRFWALHRFLRSRKYVPRLNICQSQF